MLKSLLSLAVLAMATMPRTAHAQHTTYPFQGKWDCGVATFTFTPTTWNSGAEDLAIRRIRRTDGGRAWTLLFDGGYSFMLSNITATGMTWRSGESGDTLTCKRIGGR